MDFKLFRYFLLFGDLSVFFSSIILSLFLRHLALPNFELLGLHLIYFFPLILVWLFVFYLVGLYSRQVIFFKKRILSVLLLAQGVNILIFATTFFFLFDLPIEPKLVLFIYFFVSTLLLLFWRLWIFPTLFSGLRIRIVGVSLNKHEYDILTKIKDNSVFDLEFIHLNFQDFIKSPDKYKKTFLNASVVFNNSLGIAFFQTLLFLKIIDKVNLLSKDDIYNFVGKIPEGEWENLYDILPKHKTIKYRLYIFFKRLFDLFFSLILFPLVLPLILLVAALVLLFDGRPVFYLSKRRGFLAKDFTIYKFRTMTGTDDGGEALNSKLKVTHIGKWLRLLRLDELPQILNIIKGDMSFIGPRPEIVSIAEYYEKEIPQYFMRYLLRPGLSGWAQIMHENHPHHKKDTELTKEKLEYDLFYVKEASFILDFNIFLQTVLVVLGLKGK